MKKNFKIKDNVLIEVVNKNIEEVVIPDDVIEIGTYIKKIKNKDNYPTVNEVELHAFFGCENIKKIFISKSIKFIDEDCFDLITLEEIVVDKDNEYFASKDGVLYSKDMTRLISYPKAKLDDKFTVIDTVKILERYSLSAIKATSINLSNVEVIDELALSNCVFDTITIPSTVNSIDGNVFKYCDNLNTIIVEDGNKHYTIKDGVLYDKDITTLILYPKNKEDKEFSLPKSVKTIVETAMLQLKYLEVLNTNEGLEVIECSNFSGKNLQTINISSTVKEIGDEVFYGSNIKEINVSKDNNTFCSEEGILFNKSKTCLITYPNGKTNVQYVFPNTIEVLYHQAFLSAHLLEEVVFNEGLLEIGIRNFLLMGNIKKISIPSTLNEIGVWSFDFPLVDKEILIDEKNETFKLKNKKIYNVVTKEFFGTNK